MAKKTAPAAPKLAAPTAEVPLMAWETSGPAAPNAATSLLDLAESVLDQPNEEETETEEVSTEAEPEEVEADDAEEADEYEAEEATEEDEESAPDSPVSEQPEETNPAEREADRMRLADYTKKTQEVAEERRQVEAERAAVRAERDRYAEVLAKLEPMTKPAEPDWDKLREDLEPGEYAATWTEFQRQKNSHDALVAEQQRIANEKAEEAERLRNDVLVSERAKLLEALPVLKDPAKGKEVADRIIGYAQQTYGWTPQEIENTLDHRMFVLVHKAMLYDESVKRGKEKIAPAMKVLKPGGRTVEAPTKKVSKDHEALRKQLARTGDGNAADRLIENLL